MKFTISFLFSIFTFFSFQAQDNPAYRLYDSKGKEVKYKKMLKQLNTADIVLFGEFHNNPISHWLQLEVTTDLSKERDLILGAEMFETDNQKPLNDYLADKIDVVALDTLARLWGNYKTDYAPLVDFAKTNKLNFIATNIPRRYARIVFREGLEQLEELPEAEQAWIAPLPIAYDGNLPGYQRMLDMMGGSEAHGGDNFPKAQAIKDATMAHFILKNYLPNHLFIHYNGSYHSDDYEGILWYLKRTKPEFNYLTISTVTQKDITSLAEENEGKADFIICVPENMTTTY